MSEIVENYRGFNIMRQEITEVKHSAIDYDVMEPYQLWLFWVETPNDLKLENSDIMNLPSKFGTTQNNVPVVDPSLYSLCDYWLDRAPRLHKTDYQQPTPQPEPTPSREPTPSTPQTPDSPLVTPKAKTLMARSYAGLSMPTGILKKLCTLRNSVISAEVHRKIHPLV